MRFDLRNDTFPLLTTKRVYWMGVAQELMDFISGNMESQSSDPSRYGFQGIKWCRDQLNQVIELIRISPSGGRFVISKFKVKNKRPSQPFAAYLEFQVVNGELNCEVYLRAADMGLGVPFNMASYALLNYMVAHVTNLKPRQLTVAAADAILFSEHTQHMEQQVSGRRIDSRVFFDKGCMFAVLEEATTFPDHPNQPQSHRHRRLYPSGLCHLQLQPSPSHRHGHVRIMSNN